MAVTIYPMSMHDEELKSAGLGLIITKTVGTVIPDTASIVRTKSHHS